MNPVEPRGGVSAAIPVLSLRGVRKRFGATTVLRGVDLELWQGERMALIGPNGAGKSTLFDLISCRLKPSAGRIVLAGRDVTGLPPHKVNRLGLSRSFQTARLFGQLSVADNLRCGLLWPLGYRYTAWRALVRLRDVAQRCDALLAELGLEARRDMPAAALSYAEQRMLEIGMTVAGGAGVVLLDEPTAGMSRSEAERAVSLIRRLTQGRTLLLIEHDMSVVFDLADRIAVLARGEILACDTPSRIRAHEGVRAAYLGAYSAGAALSEDAPATGGTHA